MYYYIHISERIYSDLCRVKRIFYRNPKPLNGHAPFFLAILAPLDKNERICSDFYALFKPILAIIVGGLNRSDWVGMLRFQQATPEKVVLRGKKTGNRIEMTPLPENAIWTDLLVAVQKTEEIIGRFVAYKYEDGDFKADVTPAYRNFTITYGEGKDKTSVTAPYIITSDGHLKFYTPLELNGKVIDGLKYIEGGNYGQLIPTNDVSVTITPFFPPTSFLMNGDWFFSRSGLGSGGSYWDVWANTFYPQLETTINFIAFTPNSESALVYYADVEGVGASMLLFDVVFLSDSQVTLKFTGSGNQLGVALWSNYKFQYVCMPFMNKTFNISLDNPENPKVLTLTDVSNPSNTINLKQELVEDPFNN